MGSIERFVASVLEALPADEPTAVHRHHLDVVVRMCGRRKRSRELLKQLSDAFDEVGVVCMPALLGTDLHPNQVLTFQRRRMDAEWPPPSVLSFRNESVLRDFLLDNFRQIDGLGHLKDPRAEYRLPSGRKIDLLFRVCRSEALVVVELKLARGGQGTVAEVFDYVAELRQTAIGRDERSA